MWHMGDGSGWWMLFGWFWMIGFWALIAWAVIALTRRDTSRGTSAALRDEPSALEIAESRYARGELTNEEFERMRRQLQHPSGAN